MEDEEGKYPILGTGGIIGRTNKYLSEGDCVLIGRKGTIDKPQYVGSPFWTVDTLFYSEPKKNNLPKFQYYLFQTINWKKYDESTGVPSLSAKTVEGIKVLISKITEQQKIVDFLSSIDKKLEAQENIVKRWENIKKGYMQKIFSQELKFEGFYEKWEVKQLGENSYIKGRVGWKNLKAEEYVELGIPMIANKHIINGKIEWDKCDNITEERYEESIEIALENGDVIFSKDGALGNPAFINNLKTEATINGTMMLVRLDYKKDGVAGKYFYHILNSEYFARLINEIKSGSSIPHIFQRDVRFFRFPAPKTLEEQNKIADFLSSIDEKISLEKEKLERWKNIKKGYIQKLFV